MIPLRDEAGTPGGSSRSSATGPIASRPSAGSRRRPRAGGERGARPPARRRGPRLRHLHDRPRRPGADLERRRRAAHRVLPRRDPRPALFALLHRAGRAGGRRRPTRSGRQAAEGRPRREGWRVRKDGSRLLGQRGHHRRRDRRGHAPRVHQDPPRPDRAEAGRGRAAPGATTSWRPGSGSVPPSWPGPRLAGPRSPSGAAPSRPAANCCCGSPPPRRTNGGGSPASCTTRWGST